MREIKYRGKRIDTGEWIYGGADINEGEAVIYDQHCICHSAYEVDVKTVGQHIGRDDIYGNEIYEGSTSGGCVVYYDHEELKYMADCGEEGGVKDIGDWFIVDGNIHDKAEQEEAAQ